MGTTKKKTESSKWMDFLKPLMVARIGLFSAATFYLLYESDKPYVYRYKKKNWSNEEIDAHRSIFDHSTIKAIIAGLIWDEDEYEKIFGSRFNCCIGVLGC